MSFESPEGLRIVAVTPDDEALRRRGLARIVEDVAAAGVSSVMFREKSLDDDAFVELAKRCRDACRRHRVGFVLNERVHLAALVDPDAVHLTHRSAPVAEARRRLGSEVALGISMHHVEEIHAAAGVDYVVYGPVFATPSKNGVLAPRGVAALAEFCRLARPTPVVAIGGVTRERVRVLAEVGASGFAVIRAVFGVEDPPRAVEELSRGWRAANE